MFQKFKWLVDWNTCVNSIKTYYCTKICIFAAVWLQRCLQSKGAGFLNYDLHFPWIFSHIHTWPAGSDLQSCSPHLVPVAESLHHFSVVFSTAKNHSWTVKPSTLLLKLKKSWLCHPSDIWQMLCDESVNFLYNMGTCVSQLETIQLNECTLQIQRQGTKCLSK